MYVFTMLIWEEVYYWEARVLKDQKIAKKRFGLPYLLILLFVTLAFPMMAHAESDSLVIKKVTIGNQEATLQQHTKDGSVFIARNSDRTINNGYKIEAKANTDTVIKAIDFKGEELEVVNENGNVTITKQENSCPVTGAAVCHIYVTSGEQTKEYKLVISGQSIWDRITETYIADVTTGEVNYLNDDTVIRGNESTVESYKDITVNSSVKQVVLSRFSGRRKSTTYSLDNMQWLAKSGNYVRINSSEISDFKQFESSADYQDIFFSSELTLDKGLNIIEVYSTDRKIAASDKSVDSIPEGLSAYGDITAYDCAVYLVYTEGEKQEKTTTSNDTSLKYLEATQLGSESVLMTQYGTKQEDGNWKIIVPETMPLNKIILGIVPNSSDASYEINNSEIIKGETFGMYTAVDISTVQTIPVKVTAQDNTTVQNYEFEIVRADGSCELSAIELENCTLKSYPSSEECSFSADENMYLLQLPAEGNASLGVKQISDNASYTINGKNAQNTELNISDYLTKITVTAQDGLNTKNYYFIYQEADGNIPLIQKPDDKKVNKAKSMLGDWYARSDSDRKNMMKNAYWAVFESAATNVDMNGGYVFNPEKDSYSQATTWSRAILQMVILGYNPYDVGESHLNLVEGLLKLKNDDGLFGGFANNEWALMALKVCGEEIPNGLLEYEKTNGFHNSYSVDIRGWALAAAKGVMPDDDVLEGVLDLKDAQGSNGLWGNNYTNGCVVSGIVGAGVNLDYFAVEGKSILDIMDEKTSITGSEDGFCKDMIIALGDVINGSNIWQRYTLTDEKWDNLIAVAENDLTDGNTTLKNALNKAKECTDRTGKGNIYYALYDEVAKIKSDYKVDIAFDAPDELIIPVENKNYYVNCWYNLDEDRNDITEGTHGWYNSISLFSDRTVGNRFGAACIVPDENIDYSTYTYNYMKKIATNYFGDDNGDIYLEKAYGVLLVENNAAIQNEDKNTRIANSKVFSFGPSPIKCDATWPSLAIGTDTNNLQTEEIINLKCANNLEKLVVKATDGENGSGIYNVLYSTDGENWTTIYDAVNDDQIDVDNAQGKFEKDLEIPVKNCEKVQVKVIDIAGLETVTTVNLVWNPIFAEEPVNTVDVNTEQDLAWTLRLNGAELAELKNNDVVVDSDNYIMDSENGTLTLKASYLNTLGLGNYTFTLSFTRDNEPIEETLTVAITIEDQVKKVIDQINAIGTVDLSKKDEVNNARIAYDALTETQRKLISEDILKKLTDAEALISKLEEENNSQQSTTQKQDSTTIKTSNNLIVNVSKISTNSVTLKWNKISDATGYKIYGYQAKTKKFVLIKNVNANSTSFKVKSIKNAKLLSGKIYYFKVYAYKKNKGNDVVLQKQSIKTATAPDKVKIQKVSSVTSSKIMITWNKVKRSAGYELWMKTGKTGKYKIVKTIKGASKLSYKVTGLKKGKTYYFKVRAYKSVDDKKVYGKTSKVKQVKLK